MPISYLIFEDSGLLCVSLNFSSEFSNSFTDRYLLIRYGGSLNMWFFFSFLPSFFLSLIFPLLSHLPLPPSPFFFFATLKVILRPHACYVSAIPLNSMSPTLFLPFKILRQSHLVVQAGLEPNSSLTWTSAVVGMQACAIGLDYCFLCTYPSA